MWVMNAGGVVYEVLEENEPVCFSDLESRGLLCVLFSPGGKSA